MKKLILIVLSLTLFSSSGSTFASHPSPVINEENCNALDEIYSDALEYFVKNRGDKRIKKTLFGTTEVFDYKVDLWGAYEVELSEAVDLGCNQLVYKFIEAKMLADAEKVYKYLVENFESCKPEGYVRANVSGSSALSKEHYIDHRDQDAFLFYEWPEFEISLVNSGGMYVVTIRISSKKFS